MNNAALYFFMSVLRDTLSPPPVVLGWNLTGLCGREAPELSAPIVSGCQGVT
jgi:hypothetical protein